MKTKRIIEVVKSFMSNDAFHLFGAGLKAKFQARRTLEAERICVAATRVLLAASMFSRYMIIRHNSFSTLCEQ